VLVVWNAGPPPAAADFSDAGAVVCVRVEPSNSLSNRFRPDAQLRGHAIFSLDDDLLLPCADVERAFAAWRSRATLLVGFVARAVLPLEVPSRYLLTQGSLRQGEYNVILTGAAFIDADELFPLYFSNRYAKGALQRRAPPLPLPACRPLRGPPLGPRVLLRQAGPGVCLQPST
jgi:hypothetical protein